MAKRTEDARARLFATIVYPESAPGDWREKLSALHIPALVSPLHDKDTEENGKFKKEHYHVMVYFAGKKSVDSVMKIFDTFGGVGCIVLQSKGGYARYLCHLDNPEKVQYAPTDVRCFGGADFYTWAELDSNPMLFIPDMMDFIEKHDVKSLYQFALYCRRYKPEWHKVLATKSTIYFKEYIKSRCWDGSNRENASDIVDGWAREV